MFVFVAETLPCTVTPSKNTKSASVAEISPYTVPLAAAAGMVKLAPFCTTTFPFILTSSLHLNSQVASSGTTTSFHGPPRTAMNSAPDG